MRRLGREKKGQFIIIAALMMAIMIISISSIIYSSVTYFKTERWEEYVVLIDSVKTGTARVLEISLANYTQTLNNLILNNNLNKWSNESLKRAYPGFGVILTYTFPSSSRVYQAYGVSIRYSNGLNYTRYQPTSFSAANTSASLSLTTAGLTGYSFVTSAFLKERILDAKYYTSANPKYLSVYLSVEREDSIPITNLKKDGFSLKVYVNSRWTDVPANDLSFSRYYSSTYNMFIYELRYSTTSQPSRASVAVTDTRGIRVVANSTVTSA